jgi:hypothetical protein
MRDLPPQQLSLLLLLLLLLLAKLSLIRLLAFKTLLAVTNLLTARFQHLQAAHNVWVRHHADELGLTSQDLALQ